MNFYKELLIVKKSQIIVSNGVLVKKHTLNFVRCIHEKASSYTNIVQMNTIV